MLRACRESAGEIDAVFFCLGKGVFVKVLGWAEREGDTHNIVKQIGHSHTAL
jgi:hypothetical protein